MKKILSTLVFLISFFFMFSQTNQEVLKKKLEALRGTYEIRQLDKGSNDGRERGRYGTLPENLADVIETNRKETEINRIMLNENVELVIYPKSNIAGMRK